MLNLKDILEKDAPVGAIVDNPMESCHERPNVAITSTPICVSAPSLGMCGDGDGHSLRSVRSLLTPIRSCKPTNLTAVFEQESQTPNPAIIIDSFRRGFQNESGNNLTPKALLEEPLLSPNIEELNEPEARHLLEKMLIENAGLRKEIQIRDKRLTSYKGQMLAFMEWKVRQDMDGGGGDLGQKQVCVASATGHMNLANRIQSEEEKAEEQTNEMDEKNMVPHKSLKTIQEIKVDEVYSVRRSLSFIHELASSIDVDQELLKHRFKDGCYLTNQLLLGGFAGWMSALFVKKFGKIALSAAGGGLLLLIYTARKGYVNVNYDSIYEEISHLCEKVGGDTSLGTSYDAGSDISISSSSGDESNCAEQDHFLEGSNSDHKWVLAERIRNTRKWVASHSYTVGGFFLAFIYNLV